MTDSVQQDESGEQNESATQTPRERVQHQIDHDAAVQWLGIEFLEVEETGVTLRLPVRDEMRNGFGIVHGGFPYLLADTAFAFSGTAAGTPMVTHQSNTTYTAPAKGSVLSATAKILHRYGRNVICDVSVRDDDGTVVAYLSMHGVVSKKVASTGNSKLAGN
ncbi:PaaI family thioesterase [Gulosibacter molinativorax]|uniref:PaaI family thioesterase n=1 Tax=Gulosibacter molinativorax TaxID=256821 RepID=A0ABT7CBA4_9MICO|nr:PaaI family thioesterase [Gulosibacter molinativorax]MDJ1372483.1 PaaI family thioesterase [Gulosibacter molinativorax]QUY61940.1 Hypotetical protein [Gulosibacter molinativorax]